MTDEKFTPGPWEAFDVSEMYSEPTFMVGPREFCSIAQVRAGSIEAEETGDVTANARLIAAAPDLFNALKRVVDETNSYLGDTPPTFDSWLPAARAALAKVGVGSKQVVDEVPE